MKTVKMISCLMIFVIGITMSILGVMSSAEANNALTDAQMDVVVGAGECEYSTYCCDSSDYEEYEDSYRERLSWPDPEPGCIYVDDEEYCVDVYLHPGCSKENWCQDCVTQSSQKHCSDESWPYCWNDYELLECGLSGAFPELTCGWEETGYYIYCEDHPDMYDPDPHWCWHT